MSIVLGYWNSGQGSYKLYKHIGDLESNNRIIDKNPSDLTDILWKCSKGINKIQGFDYNSLQIESTSTYRFTVWVKSNVSSYIYFGCNRKTTQNVDGSVNSNPYFFNGILPTLNEWYLLVAYIHPSDYPTDGLNNSESGIYKLGNTVKINNIKIVDYKQLAGESLQSIRVYASNLLDENDYLYIYEPRVEIIEDNTYPLNDIITKGLVWESEKHFWNNETWKNNYPYGIWNKEYSHCIWKNKYTGGIMNTFNPMSTSNNIVFMDNKFIWETYGGNSKANGGWYNSNIKIFPYTNYRFSVFVMRKGNNLLNGNTYLGCDKTTTINFDNTDNTNPYFWQGNLPEFNKWYLLVGFLYYSNYDGDINSESGIYDVITSQQLSTGEIKNFKQKINTNKQMHRTFFYYSTSENEYQYMWMPRIDVVDGNELSIIELINLIK